MPRTTTAESRRRARVVSFNDRLRACRRCHLAGYLDERESVPIARDPDPDSPVPRILLVGQAPGLRATIQDRPFAGIAGDKLRAWFERGASARRVLRPDPLRRGHPLLSRPDSRRQGRSTPLARGAGPLPPLAR